MHYCLFTLSCKWLHRRLNLSSQLSQPCSSLAGWLPTKNWKKPANWNNRQSGRESLLDSTGAIGAHLVLRKRELATSIFASIRATSKCATKHCWCCWPLLCHRLGCSASTSCLRLVEKIECFPFSVLCVRLCDRFLYVGDTSSVLSSAQI